MEMPPGSKIKILENFYALDYVLFGKSASKINTCCPTMIAEYNENKGALLSIIIEMYKHIKYNPYVIDHVDKTTLLENARHSAAKARIQCKKLVVTEQGKINIKNSIRRALNENKKVNPDELIQTKIREKAFSLAIDNILIARTLNESDNSKFLNTRQGKYIEDAYKVLRSYLVEKAIEISDVDFILSK